MSLIAEGAGGVRTAAVQGRAAPQGPPRPRILLVAAAAWLAAALVTGLLPDLRVYESTSHLAAFEMLRAVLILASWTLWHGLGRFGTWLGRNGPWLTAIALGLAVWDVAAAKTGIWPQPYFPPPQALGRALVDDRAKLLGHLLSSLELLGIGFTLGAAAGFLSGVAIGWSHRAAYWLHPVLRFVGPVPATALLPIVLFAFPSTFAAGTFLIALSTWFPVTVLTWSGVAAVPKAYYDVARTLGASPRFLLARVAVPASLPHIFVGLFMGLGHAFAVVVVAEMIGVKAGLGFYLQWAQGWAAYPNLYGALFLMALVFSGLTTALFKTRDRVLSYQKGEVDW